MKELLEAGAHFGHKTQRWNPRMKPFIFGTHNEIHIIDLQHTVRGAARAASFLEEVVGSGGRVVFVGTKRQAQDTVKECAERCGQYYVNHRWLGGTLTNFETLKTRLQRLRQLRAESESGAFESLSKREGQRLVRELVRLERKMGGLAEMQSLPAALIVVDPRREHIAIKETRTLGIPVVAMVDTNCDPEEVAYPIPANDDSIRSIRLMLGKLADLIQGSFERFESERIEREDEERAERERQDSIRRELAMRQQEAKARLAEQAILPRAAPSAPLESEAAAVRPAARAAEAVLASGDRGPGSEAESTKPASGSRRRRKATATDEPAPAAPEAESVAAERPRPASKGLA